MMNNLTILLNLSVIGDLLAWQESFLKEMEKKHVEEREILLNMLQVSYFNSN